MNPIGHRRFRREEGVALVFVLLVLAALTLPALSLLAASGTTMRVTGADRAAVECLNAADGGIHEALASLVPELNTEFQNGNPYSTSPVVVTSGDFDVGDDSSPRLIYYDVSAVGSSVTPPQDLLDQSVTVTASCASSSGTVVPVRVRGFPDAGSAFGEGFCACTDMRVNGGFSSDSYDSSLGAYDLASAGSQGNVGANGSIDVNGSSPYFDGVVTAGGSIDLSGSPTATGGSIAGGVNDFPGGPGGVTPAPQPCDCTSFDVGLATARAQATNDNGSMGDCQSYLTGTDFYIGSNDSCTLPGGTYYLTSFRIQGGHTSVAIGGPVELYLDGGGPFSLGGGGVVNDSSQPDLLQIFAATEEDIDLAGGTELAGYIYAPRADITSSGDVTIYGAVLAGSIRTNGGVQYHYDANGSPGEHVIASFDVQEWRAF